MFGREAPKIQPVQADLGRGPGKSAESSGRVAVAVCHSASVRSCEEVEALGRRGQLAVAVEASEPADPHWDDF